MRTTATLGTEVAGLGSEELLRAVLDAEDSDSRQLDSVVELVTGGGRDIRHAMAIPEAWEGERDIASEVTGFYRYHASLMEPWDGPVGVIFTDGIGVAPPSTATACARSATRCPTAWSCAAPRPAPWTSPAGARSSGPPGPEGQERLQAGLEDGVLKIVSKMGIFTVDSYRGAQIFEVLGLGPEVVRHGSAGTPSVVRGVGWAELGEDALSRHGEGRTVEGGYYRALKNKGEYHTHNDPVVKALNEMKSGPYAPGRHP